MKDGLEMTGTQTGTQAFLNDLKEVLRKHNVVINAAEYDAPAEFRCSDKTGDHTFVEIDRVLQEWSRSEE